MRRYCGIACAAVVFALGVFASSPVLHDQLHHHDAGTGDDGCVIILFAQGIVSPLAVASVPPPTDTWERERAMRLVEIFVSSPRYRWQPERGPPVVG